MLWGSPKWLIPGRRPQAPGPGPRLQRPGPTPQGPKCVIFVHCAVKMANPLGVSRVEGIAGRVGAVVFWAFHTRKIVIFSLGQNYFAFS